MMKMTSILVALFFLAMPAYAQNLQNGIQHIQNEYGRLKYQVTGMDAKIAGIVKLKNFATNLQRKNPGKIEPLIWRALIIATEADFRNNIDSITLAEQARDLLKQAVARDPYAMDGIALTSLGALYYQIPGWPVGFGNDKQAEAYFQKAVQVAPASIDTNYFYGSYLVYKNRYSAAIPYFKKGLQAKPRKGLETADEGRLDDLQRALKNAQAYAKHENRP